MKINVINSTMVKQITTTTPNSTTLWLSNLDTIYPHFYTHTVYFYRSTGGPDFFDPVVLKAALSRALDEFYPVAGRLKRNDINNRIEINCNGEGVLFVEAESEGEMDDLGEFGPKPELDLVPEVDCSLGISKNPIVLMQVTRFKCGGVCLGIACQHYLFDGLSALHFITTWSDISRGFDIRIPPFLDRTILCARSPPNPLYTHIEYHTERPPQNELDPSEMKFSMFKLTRDHLNTLKSNCNDNDGNKRVKYSTYEALAGHIWRCVCVARGLSDDKETKLYVVADGRSRLRPTLPSGYFGNVTIWARPIAKYGELKSNPLEFTASKIHDALARMDDDYLKSAIDYLELNSDLNGHGPSPQSAFNCPNLGITSWAKLPFYEVDFGWGKPVYGGLGSIPVEGECIIMLSPANDGSLVCAISLPKEQIEPFEKLLYDI